METMIDQLAHRAGRDPVDLRLDLLTEHPRDQAAIRNAVVAATGKRLRSLPLDVGAGAWSGEQHRPVDNPGWGDNNGRGFSARSPRNDVLGLSR
jgi:hypothetical protein